MLHMARQILLSLAWWRLVITNEKIAFSSGNYGGIS